MSVTYVTWKPIESAPQDRWIVVSHEGAMASFIAKHLKDGMFITVDHKPCYPSKWCHIPTTNGAV